MDLCPVWSEAYKDPGTHIIIVDKFPNLICASPPSKTRTANKFCSQHRPEEYQIRTQISDSKALSEWQDITLHVVPVIHFDAQSLPDILCNGKNISSVHLGYRSPCTRLCNKKLVRGFMVALKLKLGLTLQRC